MYSTNIWRAKMNTNEQNKHLQDQVDSLSRQIAELKERLNNSPERALQERVKELQCLYKIANLSQNKDLSIEEFLQQAITIIPPSWQYSKITCARIHYNGKNYTTPAFQETPWKLSSDIVYNNEKKGSIEVFYLEEKPTADEGPFLKEERKLLDSVAVHLGQYLERKEIFREHQKNKEYLQITLNSIGDGVITTDTEGKITLLNPVAEELTGWTFQEARGHPVEEVFEIKNSQTDEDASNPVEKVLQTGKIVGLANHTKLIAKNGDEYQIADSGSPIKDKHNNIIGVVLVFRNVTKEYKMQDKLKTSEERFRTMVERAPEPIFIQIDHKFAFLNPAACKLFGTSSPDELTGTPVIDRFHPDFHKTIKKIIKRLNKEKESFAEKFEQKIIRKDGSDVWVETLGEPIKYMGKDGGLLFVRDISQRKKAEKTQSLLYEIAKESLSTSNLKNYLKYIHKELKQIIKAENFSIALYDKHKDTYSIPFFKDKYDNFNNYTSVSLKNTLTDYVRRTGQPQLITAEKEKEISENEPIQLVGTPAPVWIGAPIVDAFKNEVIGVIVLQDYDDPNAYNYDDLNALKIISANIGLFIDRVKNLEQLQLMRKAVEQNPTAITITDAKGIIQYVNPSFCQITGYSPDQVIGKDTTFLRSGLYTEDFYQNLWETLYSGKDWIGEFNNKRANGELYWEEAIISPIVNENGETTHFIKVSEDVTEKKKMLEDLKEAKEKAEESDRLKSAFLANISHEIRTPMNGVLGFINLLNEPDLDDSTRNEYIQIVNKSGNRLLETINNIIEVSKIEAGESQVTYENIKINNIMNYLYDFFKIQTEKKNITLQTGNQISGKKGLIRTDKQKVEGMLSNLIKNAIKFTQKGSIEFGNYIENNFLVFYVKDTGIGIPEDKKEVIFERFGQADIKLTRDHEGSGIGLSIVQAYAENLGGKVWLSSELNKGSTFYFSIPYVPVLAEETDKSSTEKEPADDKTLGKQTILIAEDNQSSYKLLEALLSNEEITLIHSITGKETIQKLNQNPETSIILMDIKMPDMDGLEATKEIRKFNKTIPIIAQSAHALYGDKDKAIKSGCNDYITKPINKEDLLELIHKHS